MMNRLRYVKQNSKTESGQRQEVFTLVVFDFDGTITVRDTLNDFIISRFGYLRFILGILIIIPLLLLYLLNLVPHCTPKEKLFSHFFRRYPKDEFDALCRNYAIHRIDQITNRNCVDRIKKHKEQGHHLLIVSASLSNWIKPWADVNGFDEVISTEPEIIDGFLTGKFASNECYGMQKVNKLIQRYPDRNHYVLYVYGDSKGDQDLLSIADVGFYQCFGEDEADVT